MLPTSSTDEKHKHVEVSMLLQTITYLCLGLNSISTVYNAYTHGDFTMAAFVVFVYLGFFLLIYCVSRLEALPPVHENAARRDLLKTVVWGLSSLILFGFAYQFSAFVHPVAAVFMFALSISFSFFTLILSFLCDCHHHHQQQQQQEKQSSKVKLVAVPGPENV